MCCIVAPLDTVHRSWFVPYVRRIFITLRLSYAQIKDTGRIPIGIACPTGRPVFSWRPGDIVLLFGQLSVSQQLMAISWRQFNWSADTVIITLPLPAVCPVTTTTPESCLRNLDLSSAKPLQLCEVVLPWDGYYVLCTLSTKACRRRCHLHSPAKCHPGT